MGRGLGLGIPFPLTMQSMCTFESVCGWANMLAAVWFSIYLCLLFIELPMSICIDSIPVECDWRCCTCWKVHDLYYFSVMCLPFQWILHTLCSLYLHQQQYNGSLNVILPDMRVRKYVMHIFHAYTQLQNMDWPSCNAKYIGICTYTIPSLRAAHANRWRLSWTKIYWSTRKKAKKLHRLSTIHSSCELSLFMCAIRDIIDLQRQR